MRQCPVNHASEHGKDADLGDDAHERGDGQRSTLIDVRRPLVKRREAEFEAEPDPEEPHPHVNSGRLRSDAKTATQRSRSRRTAGSSRKA